VIMKLDSEGRFDEYIPSGVGKFGGGSGRGGSEWGLAAGTIYGLQIVPHQIGTYNFECDYHVE